MARFQNGWIKIERSIAGGQYDAIDIGIMTWLIISANYVDGKNKVRGKIGRVFLKRGQLVTSIENICGVLNLTEGIVRRRLKTYQDEGFLSSETSNHGTIITILNYNKYQCIENEHDQTKDQTNDEPTTNGDQTNDEPTTNGDQHIKELKKLRREEGKNLIQISIPTDISTETRPPPTVDGTYLEIGTRWLKIAQEEYPWRSGDKKWTVENFGRELQKIAKSLKASPDDMRRLIDRFEKDPFWRKNAASPFGLSKRSQNGLRKIDNMIASLRTEFERKQSSQTNLADLRKQFQEDFKTKEELEKILEEEDRNANRY